ncbi:MAG TPA: restriction endonuclease subunit S [Gallionella sp.]|jgi:type I restriction enzyme S subunit|nr:restriction endonuclease subunit S [Gallionella sp.]
MKARRFDIVPLGNLLEVSPQNGYSPVCPDTPTGKWVLGLAALNGYGLDLAGAKPAPVNEPLVDKFMLQPGDFLISRSNTIEKVGRIGVFRGGLDNCSYPDLMMRFRPDREKVNPDYLETYLKSDSAVKFIRQHATGSSGSMKKINQHTVESIPVLLPQIREQAWIADFLGVWYQAIEKTERLIAAKERRYTHELSRLISQGHHPRNHIGTFAHEVSERNRGGNEARVLSVTNSRGFVLPEDQFERRVASADLSNYKIVKRRQYAYNPSRINVGSIARLDDWGDGVLSPMYAVFGLDETKVNSDYFLHWLDSHEARGRIKKSAQGSVRETVSFTEFAAITTPLPNIAKQVAIARYLNVLREEISILGVYVEKLKEQKRGLMQRLLTGQWRVSTLTTKE